MEGSRNKDKISLLDETRKCLMPGRYKKQGIISLLHETRQFLMTIEWKGQETRT